MQATFFYVHPQLKKIKIRPALRQYPTAPQRTGLFFNAHPHPREQGASARLPVHSPTPYPCPEREGCRGGKSGLRNSERLSLPCGFLHCCQQFLKFSFHFILAGISRNKHAISLLHLNALLSGLYLPGTV